MKVWKTMREKYMWQYITLLKYEKYSRYFENICFKNSKLCWYIYWKLKTETFVGSFGCSNFWHLFVPPIFSFAGEVRNWGEIQSKFHLKFSVWTHFLTCLGHLKWFSKTTFYHFYQRHFRKNYGWITTKLLAVYSASE